MDTSWRMAAKLRKFINLPNKEIKFTRCAGWDAYMRGGFAIMPHMPAPLI